MIAKTFLFQKMLIYVNQRHRSFNFYLKNEYVVQQKCFSKCIQWCYETFNTIVHSF